MIPAISLSLQTLPQPAYQAILARIQSSKDFINLGMTCRTLYEQSWMALNQKYSIHLRPGETPKAAVKRFLGDFVQSVFSLSKLQTKRIFDELRSIQSLPTLGKKFEKSLRLLYEAPDLSMCIAVEALRNGRDDIVKMIFKKINSPFPKNRGCEETFGVAVAQGKLEILQTIHAQDSAFFQLQANSHLIHAIREGHLPVVKFFLQKGKISDLNVWLGQIIALVENRLDIFQLFLSPSSELVPFFNALTDRFFNLNPSEIEQWKQVTSREIKLFTFYYVIGAKDFKLMNLFFETTFIDYYILPEILYTLALRGDTPTISYLIGKCPSKEDPKFKITIEHIIKGAVKKGHNFLVKYLLHYNDEIFYEDLFPLATDFGNHEILILFQNIFNRLSQETFFKGADAAIEGGHLPVLQFLLPKLLSSTEKYNKLFLAAAAKGKLSCVQELLKHRAIDSETKTLAITAARFGHFNDVIATLSKPELRGRVFFVFGRNF